MAAPSLQRIITKVPGRTPESGSIPHRIFGLDLLRAVAILSVVWAHGGELLPAVVQHYYYALSLDGVSVFFVLSGFLIGGILIKTLEREPMAFRTLGRFWVRRWLRTLPAYYLVLLVLTILSVPLGRPFGESIPYFFFVQNLAWPHPPFFVEAWSLSVEEWFYLLTPALVFASARILPVKKQWLVLGTGLLLIAAVTALRLYRYSLLPPGGTVEEDFRKQVVLRLDSLMYGVLGAWAAAYCPAIWVRYRKPLFGCGLLVLLLQGLWPKASDGPFAAVWSFSLFSAGILLLLPLLSTLRNAGGFFARAITHISLVSYSMYLVHFSLVLKIGIHGLLWRRLPLAAHPWLGYGLYWAGSVGLATLMYAGFERPILKWRDALTGRQTAAALPDAAAVDPKNGKSNGH